MALRGLTSRRDLGVYASSDTLFKGAVFGRDSLEVCEDLLATHKSLVQKSLLTLARLQGETVRADNEEEPGKIVHEYRTTIVDGKPISGKQLSIFRDLSSKWGGSSTEMVYYGSVDATPQFIRVIGNYCKRYGPSILDTPITLRSGQRVTMNIVLERAMHWLLQHLETSRSGLVEYHRRNPHGIENQVWKDSDEFYVHTNGALANHQAPISSIEVQGIAYDALLTAAYLHPAGDIAYRKAARKLQQRMLKLLWLDERNYFAVGTDFNPSTDQLRVIETVTANPLALLDSYIFDDLSKPKRQRYVMALVKAAMSHDFLTDAGIRSRALSEHKLINFWDYHGSFVSWPKETYDIAKGLRRQGFPILAEELENRILNVCVRNLSYPEFIYVDGKGRVLRARPTAHTHGELTVVDSPNKPESVQAWTVSAILAISTSRKRYAVRSHDQAVQPEHTSWHKSLEATLLADIPRVDRLISSAALQARYPDYEYKLIRQK